jgi:hypothetical protein
MIERNCAMKYVRLFAGPDGESHFEDVNVELAPVKDYARGVPQVFLSAPQLSASLTFVSAPPGWVGEWHPAPRRQFMIKLAGQTEVVASDGERRQIGPGIAVLLEDTSGKGHYSRVLGPDNDDWFVAALAQ